jgi:cytochrome c-type biogenesis protein CcmH
MRRIIITAALALSPAAVAQPPAAYAPEIEQAAHQLGKSLRCVVCQNQSIEESAAPLAADMRRLVRERLAAGETPEQVMGYMTDRYGNFVRMQPPLQLDTLLLWFGPALLSAAAVWGWFAYLRPAARAELAPPPLSDAEVKELNQRLPAKGNT